MIRCLCSCRTLLVSAIVQTGNNDGQHALCESTPDWNHHAPGLLSSTVAQVFPSQPFARVPAYSQVVGSGLSSFITICLKNTVTSSCGLKEPKFCNIFFKKLIIDPLWTLYHSSEIRAGNVTLSLTESHVLVVYSLGTFSSFVLVISRFWALSSIKWTAIHTLWRISSLSSFELDASYHGERSSFSIRMNLVVGLEVLPISTHWPPHKPGQGVGQWSNLRKVGSNFILTFRFDKVLKFRSSWRV